MTESSNTTEALARAAAHIDAKLDGDCGEGVGAMLAETLHAAGLLRTPGEPSDEQVERAAKVLANATGEWDFYEYPHTDQARERYRKQARAALKAAGVTPQPECCMDDTNGSDASMTQVDEAALAEVLLDHSLDFDQQTRPAGPGGSGYLCECGLEILEPRTGPGIGNLHRNHLARAVAAWLKDGAE